MLRPFLNDAEPPAPATCSAARRTRSSRSSTRTPTSSTTTSRPRPRSARRSSAVFETHVQADHVSGLPALVERTGATAYLPAGAGVEFEHVALADGETVELGNTLVTRDRDAGPRAGASRLHGRRPAARRRGAVARLQRRLAADRRRRPARPARRRRRARPGAAAAREPAPAARAARPRRALPEPLRAARSAAAASPATRSPRSASSAPTTRCSRSPTPTRSPRRCVADMPPRPAEQERIVAANRAGTRGRAGMTRPVRLGLRANAGQFALLVGLNALVGAHGRPRAKRAAAGRQAGLRAHLDRRRSSPSSSPSAPPRRSRTSPPAAWPSGSGASGCSCSAGWWRCRCRC